MADAYKGLTIRIGGDTTKLTAALKAAKGAATETQRQLSAVNKAMRFDGGNLASAKTQLKLLSNRAEDLGAQLSVTTKAYQQLGDMKAAGTERTVRELASQTENAGLAAKQALDRYNAVDAALEQVYTAINKAASAEEAFGKGFDLRAEENIEETAQALRDLGVITDDQYQKLVQLRGAWQEAFDENEAAKQVATFQQLGIESQNLTSEITGLSRQMGEVRLPTNLTQSFETTRTAVSRIDEAAKVLRDDLASAEEALRIDPSNMEAARRKMSDLAQLSDLASQKAQLLGTELSALKATGADKVAASMENVSVSAERARDAYDKANSELSAAKGHLSDLLSRQKSMEQAGKQSTSEYKDLKAEVERAKEEVSQLSSKAKDAEGSLAGTADAQRFEELSAAIADAEREAEGYAGAMRTAEGASSNLWETVGDVGSALSTTVTPLLQNIGSSALDAARDIDSAYRDMRKTVNGTETDFEGLREAAIDFSTTHVTSADQILEIQAIGGELGISTDNLKEFSEVVSNIDVATDLNAEDAAAVLGHLSNITRDTADNMQGFSDSLVRLGNNGASTETDIANVAERIGSMGSIIGMSTPDILAWSSTIASTGQNSEAAGTAISKTFSDIESAVAGGGSELQAFADVAQMSAEDFADAWENDPTAALRAFIEGLNAIEASGGSADATLEGLKITSVRQKQAIMGLMQTIGGLDDNLQMSRDAWNGVSDEWGSAGDAANEADKKAEGLSGTLSQLDNIAQNAGSALGDAMLPALQQFRDLAQDAYDGFMKLSDGEKQMVVYAGGIAAALGPGLTVMSKVGLTFDGLRDRIGAGKSAWNVLASGVSQATLAMEDSAGQTRIVSQALQGLTTKQKLANAASGLMTKGLSLLKGGLAGLAIGVTVAAIGKLVEKFNAAKEHEELLEKATRTVSDTMGSARSAASNLGDAIGQIEPDSQGVLQSLADLNDSVRDTFAEIYVSSAKLDQYVAVIDELANKSDLTATEQFRLQEAVKGYNDVTGSQYEIVDKVNGVIADQSGTIQENTQQIDDNAEAWKRKAEAEAYANLATKYLEQKVEASYNLQLAQEKLSTAQDRLNELNEKGANKTRDEVEETRKLNAEIPQLEQSVSDCSNSLVAAGNASDYYSTQAQIAASDLSDAAKQMAQDVLLSVNGMGDGVKSALDEQNISMYDLTTAFANAGISAEDLNGITSEQFAEMVQSSGGNIDTLIGKIRDYNTQPVDDKDADVSVDTSSLDDAQQKVATWNGSFLKNLASKVTMTIDKVVNSVGNAEGGIRPHADGGVRLHAGGAIATRAVPLDIVGEAGAEAIVPLTNRRYSQPFADIISDAVIDRLSKLSGGGGTTINQSFQTKVVRADSDLYTAAPIIYRDAMNEARRVM